MKSKPHCFKPEDMMEISTECLIDIQKQGFAYVTLPNGNTIKITEKDIFIPAEDVERIDKLIKSGEISFPAKD